MREAIEQYVDREERRDHLRQRCACRLGRVSGDGPSCDGRRGRRLACAPRSGRRRRAAVSARAIHATHRLDAAGNARHRTAAWLPRSEEPRCRTAAVRAIRQSVKALAAHPEIGRPVEEMAPEFREWFIQFGDSGYVATAIAYDGRSCLRLLAVRTSVRKLDDRDGMFRFCLSRAGAGDQKAQTPHTRHVRAIAWLDPAAIHIRRDLFPLQRGPQQRLPRTLCTVQRHFTDPLNSSQRDTTSTATNILCRKRCPRVAA